MDGFHLLHVKRREKALKEFVVVVVVVGKVMSLLLFVCFVFSLFILVGG